MDTVNHVIKPVLKAENPNVLCQLYRFCLVPDVALLCIVLFFLFPLGKLPAIHAPGHQEANKAGGNGHRQQHRADPG